MRVAGGEHGMAGGEHGMAGGVHGVAGGVHAVAGGVHAVAGGVHAGAGGVTLRRFLCERFLSFALTTAPAVLARRVSVTVSWTGDVRAAKGEWHR